MSSNVHRFYYPTLKLCIAVVKENGDGENVKKIAASEGGLSRNVGQATFCAKGLHRFAKIKLKFTDVLLLP